MFVFSQTSIKPPSTTTSILIWSCVLVAMLIFAFLLAARVKKRMRDDEEAHNGPATGFTLSDLRDMHRAGDISDEEFERAKAKIVATARRAADRDGPKPRPEKDDDFRPPLPGPD